jgi:hypothetical protein
MKKTLFVLLILFVANFVKAQTGIGTTAPKSKLHIKDNGSILRLEGADHAYLELFPQGSVTRYGYIGYPAISSTQLTFMNQFTTGSMAFGTNGTNKMFLSSDGKLSIGTSTATSTLTVGAADGSVAGEIHLNPTSNQFEGGQLVFKRSMIGSTVDWTIDQYGTSSTDARLRIFNGNSENNGIAILENGNIGFGTALPTARLNLAGGGLKIFSGFGNSTSRPNLNTSSIGNYEIRGVGAGGGATQGDASDDGFLRLSAGGGTNTNQQASIDLSGYSLVADMGSNIVMRTSGVERLRISANGKMGLGISSPGTSIHIENGNSFGNPSSTNSPSIYVMNNNNASSTANSTIVARTAGTGGGKPYFSLDVNGFSGYSFGINNPSDQLIINASWDFNTTASNNAIIVNRSGQTRVAIPEQGGAYTTDWSSGWGGGLATYDLCAASIKASNYVTRSDIRLKNTILNIDSLAITKFLNLRPVTFFWNQEMPRDINKQYGLIAQEVEILFPEMVSIANDSMQTKAVNYQALHAISLKVIQSQQAEIDMMKKKQMDIEQRLLKLEAKLN